MNDQRFPRKTSLLQLMRERVCDDGAALAVVRVFFCTTGVTLLVLGRREELIELVLTGLLCAVISAGLWIISPDALQSPHLPIGTRGHSEIGQLTDDEFDALVEQIEREAQPSIPAVAPPAGRHDAARVRGVTTRPGWQLRLRRAPTTTDGAWHDLRVARYERAQLGRAQAQAGDRVALDDLLRRTRALRR